MSLFMFKKESLVDNTHYGKHRQLEKGRTEKHFIFKSSFLELALRVQSVLESCLF